MKVAAVQMDVKILENEHNLEHILDNLEQAARAGAKLAVFPECALSGYCFSTREEAMPAAETVPGPPTEKIAEAAKRLNISAVVGMLERAGDSLYNAAVVITPEGIQGTHRKIHLLHLGIDRYDVAGDVPFPVFEAAQAKIGVNICFDCSFPESGRVLKLKGAQILAIPTNWPVGSDTWAHIPRVRAIENHMYVIAADRVGEERGFRFAGHSQIIDVTGDVLAEAGETEETILYADLEPARADENRVVRIPGAWEYDRMAARRPEMYGPIALPKSDL
ncbi:MAG TPA: carbon-nitrogen hydrolase family protein [Terriglobia bacterium]|jgi:predicted amidohydrolase|nr:carbon-nitrogen hydrolase family protein [Terriglobia bacterium]